ncbi:MAG: response regulator transcription factor [Porphyromonas sp.]|nr:response regulator transcription factor [Porphyromonas sp.]
MSATILIVDDDPSIVEILSFNLKHEGFEVLSASSAEEGLVCLESHRVDLILLDVMMAGMSGYRMAESLRQRKVSTPIIFTTARTTENDMLTGFSVGGDDYIAKPFSLKEVTARCRAVLKRSIPETKQAEQEEVLRIRDLEINTETREVCLDGESLGLTKKETELLIYLVTHPNRTFSRSDLIEALWRETPYITERTVDVHIARLRKKLTEPYAACIVNRLGYGYKFVPPAL